MVYRGLSPEAQAHYVSAFPSIASRKAVRQWPLEIPIDGKPADNTAAIKAYGEWLTRTQLPKSCFTAAPEQSSEHRSSYGAGSTWPISGSSISVTATTSSRRTIPTALARSCQLGMHPFDPDIR